MYPLFDIPQAEKDECPIFCPASWAPVCGSNGKTYTNRCRLEVANCRSTQQDGPVIELVHNGVCKSPREDRPSCLRRCRLVVKLPFTRQHFLAQQVHWEFRPEQRG